MTLLQTYPPARVNDAVPWASDYLRNAFRNNIESIPSKFIHGSDRTTHSLQMPLLQQAFLHVVTETVFHYPQVYLTEKSFKGIVIKRPFVIVGPVGSLAEIKRLGFRTFDSWWDESYDNEEDPSLRLLKVIDIIEQINALDIEVIQKMCIGMSDVLEYNFNFYKNEFMKNSLEDFKQQLERC